MKGKWIMIKKTVICLVILITLSTARAEIIWVPQNYPSIQKAIDNSNDGDVVIVSPGRYLENINFNGRNITVRGTNPEGWDIVEATIIDANGAGSTVTFDSNEPNTAVLTGFTITGGKGSFMDNEVVCVKKSPWGGGILCNHASPTITHNIITGNDVVGTDRVGNGYQPKGGGIACFGGEAVITHNIIHNNNGYDGGGLRLEGNPLVRNNLIYDNTASFGGGVDIQGGRLINNTIAANYVSNVHLAGPSTAINNIIYKACGGPGLYLWGHDTLEGLLDCYEVVKYNNVWGNSPSDYRLQNSPTDMTGIMGNMSADPRFVDPNHYDYHLAGNSPCIDAGDPNMSIGNEPEPNGSIINLGAYGGTSEAKASQ
jgi:hypothetical protein